MNSKVRTVRRLRDKVLAVQREIHAAMAEAYPDGTRTHYRHGEHWVPCEVLEVNEDRVRVRTESGKTLTLNGYRLRGAWSRYLA